MYTYRFFYNDEIDGLGVIEFCAENQTEAEGCFEAWVQENGYIILDYTVEIVYNKDDAEYYGDKYFGKPEDCLWKRN